MEGRAKVKVLTMQGYFQLPQNFKGDKLDALKLLVKYYKKNRKDQQQQKHRIPGTGEQGKVWNKFLDVIKDTKHKLVMNIYASEKVGDNMEIIA